MKQFTAEELDIIRTRYPDEGKTLARVLGRPVSSICKKAQTLKVRRRGYERHITTRYVWTEAEDQLIRTLWPAVLRKETKVLAIVGRFNGASHHQIRARAALLGVARYKPGNVEWTAAEDEYLCEWAHLGLDALIDRFKRKGWTHRTRAALANRLRHLSQRTRGVNDVTYSAKGLATLMGLSSSGIVIRWIRAGWLPAKPRTDGQNPSGGPKEWMIHPKDARRFICEHTALVDLSHADKYWLVDLLSGAGDRP